MHSNSFHYGYSSWPSNGPALPCIFCTRKPFQVTLLFWPAYYCISQSWLGSIMGAKIHDKFSNLQKLTMTITLLVIANHNELWCKNLLNLAKLPSMITMHWNGFNQLRVRLTLSTSALAASYSETIPSCYTTPTFKRKLYIHSASRVSSLLSSLSFCHNSK